MPYVKMDATVAHVQGTLYAGATYEVTRGMADDLVKAGHAKRAAAPSNKEATVADKAD